MQKYERNEGSPNSSRSRSSLERIESKIDHLEDIIFNNVPQSSSNFPLKNTGISKHIQQAGKEPPLGLNSGSLVHQNYSINNTHPDQNDYDQCVYEVPDDTQLLARDNSQDELPPKYKKKRKRGRKKRWKDKDLSIGKELRRHTKREEIEQEVNTEAEDIQFGNDADIQEYLTQNYQKLGKEIDLLKLVDSMRQKLKDIIAWKVNERKLKEEEEFREFKREEKHFVEIQRHKLRSKKRKNSMSKKQEERMYKLMSRGMPSYLYNNLNKAMM